MLSVSLYSYNHQDNECMDDAVEYAWSKGCVLAACAGNDGGSTPNYPAAVPDVIAVAASDSTDTLAGFSKWGTWVSIAAPGGQGADINDPLASQEITSTWPGGGYHWDWGTSMATPVVAGEAALMWAQNPGFSNQQIHDSIISAVDAVKPYKSGQTIGPSGSGGRANVYRALQGCVPGKIVACADFTGDGLSDFALQDASTGQVAIWAMDCSTLLWGAGVAGTVSGGYTALFSGDFDGNGTQDLLFQNSSTGQLAVWLMNGPAAPMGGPVSGTVPSGYVLAGAGDFNGDGKTDAVLFSQSTGQVIIWYLNGTSIVGGGTVSLTIGSGFSVAGVGNLDGAGDKDLVFFNASTGNVVVWFMSGITVSSYGTVALSIASGYRLAAVADMNGDGKSDLVFEGSSSVVMWFMNGLQVSSYGTVNGTVGSGYSVVGTGDYNLDGHNDLAFQNSGTGQIAFWYMDGLTLLGGGAIYPIP